MADERFRGRKQSFTTPKWTRKGKSPKEPVVKDEAKKSPSETPKDSFREVIETVVFVVVLVLLLKTFVAEAFVIPTGSMATTLLGYHKTPTCRQCGYSFTVNGKEEVKDADNPLPRTITQCICPNCRYQFDPRNP